jgi:hypothetical protein
VRFAIPGSRISAATLGACAVCLLGFAASASAQTGGATATDPNAPPAVPTGPPGRATLLANGQALAPSNAPPQVAAAIAAANSIATRPYTPDAARLTLPSQIPPFPSTPWCRPSWAS